MSAHRLLDDKALRHGRKESIQVETWTLDDRIAAHAVDVNEASLVEVDTQGWESHVLTGAARFACSGSRQHGSSVCRFEALATSRN